MFLDGSFVSRVKFNIIFEDILNNKNNNHYVNFSRARAKLYLDFDTEEPVLVLPNFTIEHLRNHTEQRILLNI